MAIIDERNAMIRAYWLIDMVTPEGSMPENRIYFIAICKIICNELIRGLEQAKEFTKGIDSNIIDSLINFHKETLVELDKISRP